jgi:hypothetical protein
MRFSSAPRLGESTGTNPRNSGNKLLAAVAIRRRLGARRIVALKTNSSANQAAYLT